MRTIHAQSGHTLALNKIDELPILEHYEPANYSSCYSVHNRDASGVLFFHVAKHKTGEWHVWYRGGKMWTPFGKTLQTAIDGAQKDGWLYA